MLNLSNKNKLPHINPNDYSVFDLLKNKRVKKKPTYIILIILLVFIILLFLPWTQNIQGKGYVITRNPDQRPQSIQSVIAGRLEKWYVTEGDFVNKGDTIVYVTEVKNDYFDPNLITRTSEQVTAKSQSVDSYNAKVQALEQQYNALAQNRDNKLAQNRNKIQQTQIKLRNDASQLTALRVDLQIAQKQLNRTQELYNKGLKSLTDLEAKRLKFQEAQAKVSIQEGKVQNQRNELANLDIQLSTIRSEYADKMAKSQSDKYTALSNKLNASANTAKLKNQLSNYSVRQQFYYITAPQSGYITKTIKKGVGEIIKEGTDIVTIMPELYDLAVEMYIKPNDLPLVEMGSEARIQFDGWPAIVFSGWPNNSLGTFSGKVVAIDRFISNNGQYRILLSPSNPNKPWPEQVRVGSGTNAFLLLRTVPIWYEVWRQLNGFPPDFYQEDNNPEVKTKAPIKSIK